MMTREQIKAAALELDPVEREVLAEELLLSIDEKQREAIDEAWLIEARRRDAEFRDGKIGAQPVEEVVERIARRATQ
jgi:putative addiction module component (TIGR02574 family)